MKSNIFKEVINEELIEINKSVPKTIQCLREQSGGCAVSTPKGMRIYFKCSKNGKISVYSSFEHQRGLRDLDIYYVSGKVISKDNKTYVKITSVYKKLDIWLRIFSIVLFILLAPILFILKAYIEGTFFIPALLAFFVVFIIAIINSINITLVRKRQGLEIVKLMEKEIKKRVENIKHWDD